MEEKIIVGEKNSRSPYRKWTQLNKEKYTEMDWLIAENPSAFRVLMFLINKMDGYNSLLCSSKVIEKELQLGRATVSRDIRFLKEHNYIAVLKSGTSNIYCINKTLAWNSAGSNYDTASFNARVIIGKDEQEETELRKLGQAIKIERCNTASITETNENISFDLAKA